MPAGGVSDEKGPVRDGDCGKMTDSAVTRRSSRRERTCVRWSLQEMAWVSESRSRLMLR